MIIEIKKRKKLIFFKVFEELEAVVDKLATDSQRGSYSVKKTNGSSLPRNSNYNNSSLIINNISPSKPSLRKYQT